MADEEAFQVVVREDSPERACCAIIRAASIFVLDRVERLEALVEQTLLLCKQRRTSSTLQHDKRPMGYKNPEVRAVIEYEAHTSIRWKCG